MKNFDFRNPYPSTRIPVFVEEALRMDAPVKSQFRLAKKNTKVGDLDVPAGTTMGWSSAADSQNLSRNIATLCPAWRSWLAGLVVPQATPTRPGRPGRP